MDYHLTQSGGKSRRRRSRSGSKKRKGNAWTDAVGQARKELGITGFMAVKKGSPLYKRAKEILGWQPQYGSLEGFRKGLEISVDWFRKPENLARYKAEIYNV